MVVWVSVHTTESMHQPHVTDDALVGGVYYIKTPRHAGRLHIYDPRGKSPLDLRSPLAASSPPFHRGIGIEPEEGKLVLFPGWLVHAVLPSSNHSMNGHDTADISRTSAHTDDRVMEASSVSSGSSNSGAAAGYRVSMSLNLKGEWYDTSGLHYKECDIL